MAIDARMGRAQWFNTDQPLRVADLRGQVVLVQAFQMLCPGCVMHAIPQARQVHEQFADQGVAMIGLHTVFEHHDAMRPHALAAFIHEYGLRFPVGVDAPSADGQPVPRTMARWGVRRNEREQVSPGDDGIHLVQDQTVARALVSQLESALGKADLVHRWATFEGFD